MCVSQCVGELQTNRGGVPRRKWFAVEIRFETGTVDDPADDVRSTIGDTRFVDRNDSRVLKLCRRARFTRQELDVAFVCLFARFAGQLEGHVATEMRVMCLPDDSEGPFTQHFEQLE